LQDVPANLRTAPQISDLEITLDEVDVQLVKQLEMLEPFGSLNPKPIFKIRNVNLSAIKWMKELHVKWFFDSPTNPKVKVQGVSFHYTSKWNALHPDEIIARCQKGETCSLFATLGINRFRGNEYIQLMVSDIGF
jgi:single-stranded-DNA-specific exonuclease